MASQHSLGGTGRRDFADQLSGVPDGCGRISVLSRAAGPLVRAGHAAGDDRIVVAGWRALVDVRCATSFGCLVGAWRRRGVYGLSAQFSPRAQDACAVVASAVPGPDELALRLADVAVGYGRRRQLCTVRR